MLIEEVIQETIERQKRSKNIILYYNVNETENDLLVAKDIISQISNVKTDHINVYRLGKKEQDKNRPIKIELESASDAKTILINKTSIIAPYENVKINNDLTIVQRQYLKDLGSKLNEMNAEDPTKKFKIKYVRGVPKIIEA